MIDDGFDAIMQRLFTPRRAVQITEVQAVELGSEMHADWQAAPAESWVCDVTHLVILQRDAARWRRLVGALTNVLVVVGVLGSLAICVVVLALLAKVMA